MFFKEIKHGKLWLYYRGELIYVKILNQRLKEDPWCDSGGMRYNFHGE
jgi:hypothetical protein